MADEAIATVNPNEADVETLMSLPGVGRALAERIIAARPFRDAQDMLRVSGLGSSKLSAIEPNLTFSSAAPGAKVQEALERARQAGRSAAQSVGSGWQQLLERVERAAEPKSPGAREPFSRSETAWLVLGTGVLSAIAAVLLTLAILAGLNGTLRIGRARSIRQLENQVADLQITLEDLSARLETVDRRLRAVEGLNERLASVEEGFDTLHGDVQAALEAVDGMQSSVEELQASASEMSTRINRFQGFLDGLADLLSGLLSPGSP